jgi:outer membrane receptor protein involved in Fe transport
VSADIACGNGRAIKTIAPNKGDTIVIKTHQWLGRSSLGSMTVLAGLMIAGPAFAQAVPPAASPDAAGQEPVQEIVVTGSRIARPDLTGTSPIAVVGQQDIALKAGSANIENVLNDLPQVTATTSSTSNNPGGGVATVNLRGLGSQRTLVLVDGRRYMSFDVTQIVDLNTIPSALIQRVEVVTGGQSAVYGSDAIAGVVNFILKRDFSGVELNSQYNITGRGDGQEWDINGTIGSNFDDGRGNVTMFAQYTKRKPTFAGDRSFGYFALSDNEDGSPPFAAGGSPSVPQGRINVAGLGAALGQGAACNIQTFSPSGGTSHCYAAADGYNFSPINYLQVPQERFMVSAMAHYEISDAFQPYMEAQFSNNRVTAQLAATPISNGTPFGADDVIGAIQLQTNSPYFSPQLQSALGSLDTDHDGYVSANFNYRTTQIGPRVNFDERNAFRIVAGMKGDIGAGFSYDGYYMYARTKNSQRQLGNVAIDKFINAVTTSFDANGNLQCADAAARAAGCAPANIFGLNQLSQAAADYISVGATNLEQYNTQVASFVVTNSSLFDLGAGGVGIAAGAEWRSESGSVTPDTYLASGNVAGFNPGQPTSGRYSVKEFFGEIHVPLLSDHWIHRLEVNGAARYTHYSNAPGNVFTWSAGLEFAPIRDVTFRGNYQRAIRGPSVNELYLGQTVSFAGNADSCGTAAAAAAGQLHDICVAQFNAAGAPLSQIGNPIIQDPNNVNPLTFLGGNPNLREETAKTFTIGAVFTPTFLRGFSATVDYYNVKISNYIVPGIGTQTIGQLCFNSFNLAYCGSNVISRNSFGEIDTFRDLFVNSGGLKTSGIDVSAGYTSAIGQLFNQDAKLSFSFDGTHLIKNDFTPVVGFDLVYHCAGAFGANCGVPTPKWRHTARATLGVGPFTGSLQWRYIGKAHDDDPTITYGSEHFKAQNYFDLTASADVGDHLTLTTGVSNMFDKKPPLAASTQNGGNGEQTNTFPTLYDVLGRSFFVSARVRF